MNTIIPAVIHIPGLGCWPGFVSNEGRALVTEHTVRLLIDAVKDRLDDWCWFDDGAYEVSTHDKISRGSIAVFPKVVEYAGDTFPVYRIDALVDDYRIVDAYTVVMAILTACKFNGTQVKNIFIALSAHRGTCAILDAILDGLDDWLIPRTFNLKVPSAAEVLTWDTELE